MKTTSARRLRRAGTGAAFGALVASTLMLSPAAQASTYTTVDDLHLNTDYTRSAGHNEFLNDGVHVYTDDATPQAKAAAYFDVDMPLADVGEPGMAWATDTATTQPGLQLVVDLDGDGDSDGTLVGEPVYNGNWWLPGSTIDGVPVAPSIIADAPKIGGGGSADNGPLSAWRTAFPNAQVLQSGWSLGSGIHGDGTIYRISVGSTHYVFSKATVSEKMLYAIDIDQSETRTTGHNDFRPNGGVRVWTESNASTDKAAGYFAVNRPLAGTGEPSLDYRHTSGGNPSVQLGVDFDGNGSQDGYLVGETVYGNDWWISNGSPTVFKDAAPSHSGGFGSANHGTLNQWRAVFPDAKIVTGGWSLGSGVKGDGVLNGMTIGTTKYEFTGANRAPSATTVSAKTTSGKTLRVTLKGSDADGDALTYTTPASSGATVVGNRLTFVVAKNFAGHKTLSYTVSDGSDSATGKVKISVGKANTGTRATLSPKHATSKSRIKISATINSTGKVEGAFVRVYEGKRLLGSGHVGANHKVRIKLSKKLKKGTHKLRTSYRGNGYTNVSQYTVRVKIKK